MPNLPDKVTPLGCTIQDADIHKHFRPGPPGVVYHLFRRDHRQIIEQHLKGVLPTVEGDNPREDNSSQWHFRLPSSNGTNLLPKGRPLGFKGGVPKPAIDHLEERLQLYAKNCAAGSPTARELVKHFRLPDPEKHPELYRLVGKKWKPQLTVLWGFDFPKDGGSKVLPSEAIAALRKRECHPFWPIFQHLIVVPLLLLLLLGSSILYGPTAYKWVSQMRDSKAQQEIRNQLQTMLMPDLRSLEQRFESNLTKSKELQKGLNDSVEEAEKTEGPLDKFLATADHYEKELKKVTDDFEINSQKLKSIQSDLSKLEKVTLSPSNQISLVELNASTASCVAKTEKATKIIDDSVLKLDQLKRIAGSTRDRDSLIMSLANELTSISFNEESFKEARKLFENQDDGVGAIQNGSLKLSSLLDPEIPKFETIIQQLPPKTSASVKSNLDKQLIEQYLLIVGIQELHKSALEKERDRENMGPDLDDSIPTDAEINILIKKIDEHLDRWSALWNKAGLIPGNEGDRVR